MTRQADSSPQQPSPEWLSKRTQIGVIAIIGLVGAIVLYCIPGIDATLPAMMQRVGIVMGLLWLAMPVIGRVRRWIELTPSLLVMGTPICLAVPQFRPLLIVLLVLAGMNWWRLMKKRAR